MRGKTVPPHSVLPTLHSLVGGGYLLSGGRGGIYLWHCPDTQCVDEGTWETTNLAAHHNSATKDPFGPYSPECVDEKNWDHHVTGLQNGVCPSKEYVGLVPLSEPGSFLACCE